MSPLQQGNVQCGGSLISYNKVLTAAHCSLDKSLKVRIGAKNASEGPSFDVVKIFEYNGFHRGAAGDPVSDIKIIEISNTDISLGKSAISANTDAAFPYLTTSVTVSGYGRVASNGAVAGCLRSVTVPIVRYDTCHTRYRDLIDDENICAGSVGLDSCQGDSGSGLWARSQDINNDIVLVGVVSYGYGCAAAGSPGVYARVSAYNSWMTQIMLATPQESDLLAVATAPSRSSSLTKTKIAIFASGGIAFATVLVTISLFIFCWQRQVKA
jgi:trypsin